LAQGGASHGIATIDAYMSIYLLPDEIINNPEYIQIELKSDGYGRHKMSRVTHHTRIPSVLGDGWEDVLYFRHIGSHTKTESSKNGLGGFVYVLTNKQYPGDCKIGFTTSEPSQRLQQINSAGVMDDWDLEFFYKCSHPYDFEQALHLKLEDVRIRKDREFFYIDPIKAIELINEMGALFGPL